jgi:hypothetical protein
MKTTDSGGRRYTLQDKEVSKEEYEKAKSKKQPAPPASGTSQTSEENQ